MIGKLTGKIEEIYDDSIILNVSGVGYELFVPSSILTILEVNLGAATVFFIETHVREDHIHLYGFLTKEERDAFRMLQTVSGIGAKVALNILSHLSPSQIQTAVDAKDKDPFRNISGIGPKLAERMLIELKGKTFSTNFVIESLKQVAGSVIEEEAVGALVNLGINKAEAVASVKNILQNTPNAAIDHVIRIALQNRSK